MLGKIIDRGEKENTRFIHFNDPSKANNGVFYNHCHIWRSQHDVLSEHGYFRSPGRGGNFAKKGRKFCSRRRVTMRVGAIESTMFMVSQNIFVRTTRLLKKF